MEWAKRGGVTSPGQQQQSHILAAPIATAILSTVIAVLGLHFMHARPKSLHHGRPTRIVAMSPGIAEILFALQMGPQVAGITDNTTYPPRAIVHKTRIGGFFSPSFERILTLDPDLVVCRSDQRELAEKLRDSGLSVLRVPDKSLADVLTSIIIIGSSVGQSRRAKALSDRMRAELNQIRRLVSKRPLVPTLIIVGRADATLRSLYGVGRHTVLDRLITLAGGRNVLAQAPVSYPVINKEALLHNKPKVVIEISAPPSPWSIADVEKSWRGFFETGSLACRLHVSRQTYWLVPGPRLVDAARQLAVWIHPEVAERLRNPTSPQSVP